LIVGGVLAGYLFTRKPAQKAEPTPLHGEGVLAADAPSQAAPAVSPSAPVAVPAAVAPAVAAPAPVQPVAAPKPAPAAQPPAAVAAPEKPASAAPEEQQPEQPKPAASSRNKPKRGRTPTRAPAADAPEGVLEARDALRALDSEPVMQIKPKPSADAPDYDVPDPEPPSLQDLPEPPPAPEE
jgi:hypothetical protein